MKLWDGLPDKVQINEVSPRDGFQVEDDFIPMDRKVEIIDAPQAQALKG